VHATAPAPSPKLISQLTIGGRLVVPIAEARADMLTMYRRVSEEFDAFSGDGLERRLIGPCRFVPLIGTEGFPE
jgi:protein-L-isoaspartate O-methyltransferase